MFGGQEFGSHWAGQGGVFLRVTYESAVRTETEGFTSKLSSHSKAGKGKLAIEGGLIPYHL